MIVSSPRLPHPETHAEETASAITHALGIVLSITALTVLVEVAASSGDARRIVTGAIFGSTLLITYAASTCYHFVRSPKLKRAMRILDHASIYTLIAGTYTPIALVAMRGRVGLTFFCIIWSIALFGVIAKLFFVDRFEILSVSLYIAMGWLAVIAIHPMSGALHFGGLIWLFAGGLAYTAGVGFYLWDHLPFNHAIWHLFVLAGSVCHFFTVLFYVMPTST